MATPHVAAHAPTAQGFVFAAWVYCAALVRYGGPKYIPFYLYGVLFAFNGIYRSINVGGFDRQLLLADFISYAWGLAIALGVNILILPTTAESQLRSLLVTSLQHVATLAHLTCKTYARELDAEESEVRHVLAKSLRSDFLALDAQLDEVKYETTFSRYSLRHFREMIAAVQALQQALITASSAIDLIDSVDPNGFSAQRLLSGNEMLRSFAQFRHGIDLVIAEIIDELVGPVAVASTLAAGAQDPEKAPAERTNEDGAAQAPAPRDQAGRGEVDDPERLGAALHTVPTPSATKEKLVGVSAKLKREVHQAEMRHRRIREEFMRERSESRRRTGSSPGTSRPGSLRIMTPRRLSSVDAIRGRAVTRESDETILPGEDSDEQQASGTPTSSAHPTEGSNESVMAVFRRAWDSFARAQQNALVSLIKDGSVHVDDVLLIETGMPSIKEM